MKISRGEVDKLAKKLWNYHHLHHKLKKTDCILVLGGHDLRVAKRGVEIFLDGWAPLIVFSGGRGGLTKNWEETEAERFAKIAIEAGVSRKKILIETESENTGENIIFTKKLLQQEGIKVAEIIIVTKPQMERRAFATLKKHWPDKEVIITSPQFSLMNIKTTRAPEII